MNNGAIHQGLQRTRKGELPYVPNLFTPKQPLWEQAMG